MFYTIENYGKNHTRNVQGFTHFDILHGGFFFFQPCKQLVRQQLKLLMLHRPRLVRYHLVDTDNQWKPRTDVIYQ